MRVLVEAPDCSQTDLRDTWRMIRLHRQSVPLDTYYRETDNTIPHCIIILKHKQTPHKQAHGLMFAIDCFVFSISLLTKRYKREKSKKQVWKWTPFSRPISKATSTREEQVVVVVNQIVPALEGAVWIEIEYH